MGGAAGAAGQGRGGGRGGVRLGGWGGVTELRSEEMRGGWMGKARARVAGPHLAGWRNLPRFGLQEGDSWGSAGSLSSPVRSFSFFRVFLFLHCEAVLPLRRSVSFFIRKRGGELRGRRGAYRCRDGRSIYRTDTARRGLGGGAGCGKSGSA